MRTMKEMTAVDGPLQLPDPRPVDPKAYARAQDRLNQLTKPVGSLGLLEPILCDLAAIQGRAIPSVRRPRFLLFAADHGVASNRSISRYGQHVTEEMVVNIAMGTSVSSVMARNMGVALDVYDVGVLRKPRHPRVHVEKVGLGTADFTYGPAMTKEQCGQALANGMKAALRAVEEHGMDLLILGEMGIGNTTAASALAAWLLDLGAQEVVGPGTGIADEAVASKRDAVERACALWQSASQAYEPDSDAYWLAGMAQLGGFELAAMAGAILQASASGVAVLLDGLLAGVCALWATRMRPQTSAYLIAGHRSPEPAHGRILSALGKTPLLDMGLRVGEGTGAMMAWPLIKAGCEIMAETATFADARVSNPFAADLSSDEGHLALNDTDTRREMPPVAVDFDDAERKAVYKAIAARRDVRVFLPDPVPVTVVRRILEAGHQGPSVGYMQPWNFIAIRDKQLLAELAELVERERVRAGEKFPDEQRDYYLRLKVEGLREAPWTICVTNDPTRGGPVVLGRNTIPETDLMSTACAIENMWLAARAEGIGMGWVSMYEKEDLRTLLGIPEHIDPVALLSLGYTPHFADEPILQRVGWRNRIDIDDIVFFNGWAKPWKGDIR